MIQVIQRKGVLCSHFICDVCQKPIESVGGALMAMPDCFEAKDQPIEVFHVHKGKCQRELEYDSPMTYGDLEMRDHIASLLVNIGWRRREWEDAMKGWGLLIAGVKKEPEDEEGG